MAIKKFEDINIKKETQKEKIKLTRRKENKKRRKKNKEKRK